MQKFLLALIIVSTLISCGKSNNINSSGTSGVSGYNTYSAGLSNFEGNYDLIQMGSEDCGASIQIIRDCDGLKLFSNHLGPEEFCNINRGEISSTNVTLVGNELKAVMTEFDNSSSERDPQDPRRDPSRDPGRNPRFPQNKISFSTTLTLNNDKTLVKISNLKSRNSRCLYLKR